MSKWISWAEFGKLRLHEFLPQRAITKLAHWEFMDTTWVGEAAGFTEWLCLEADPEVLRSLALDLADLSSETVDRVRARLGAPELRRGMVLSDVVALFPGCKTSRLLPDRTQVEARGGGKETYAISCTVHDEEGLIYLVVMRGDYRGRRRRR